MLKKYTEVFSYFLKLGFLGFGGPLSVVGMIQRDLVSARQWMSLEEFTQVFALIKSMPGPISFQMAVFFGRKRAGILGAFLAALGFILPAFLLMLFFGYYYQAFSALHGAKSFLIGMQAAAVVMIVIGLKPLFSPHIGRATFWILLVISAVIFSFSLVPEPVLILGGAALWALGKNFRRPASVAAIIFLGDIEKLKQLVFVCAKAGAIVFGTGLAIVPLLEKDFVERLHWVSHAQFMDALALGQISPGPVVITATFIGYKELGFLGALFATLAIFFPSFFHMVTWFPYAVNFLSKQKWIKDFAFSATAIIMGTLIVTVVRMVEPWMQTPWAFAIFAFCLAFALKAKIPSWALIPIGGGLGYLMQFLG